MAESGATGSGDDGTAAMQAAVLDVLSNPAVIQQLVYSRLSPHQL